MCPNLEDPCLEGTVERRTAFVQALGQRKIGRCSHSVMKHIGIVCEGTTDFILLTAIIDKITGEKNKFFLLQPDADARSPYGNGWKGVLKWCRDHGKIKEQIMSGIQPTLDFLVIQMDGDVSRKDKPSHCFCESTICPDKGKEDPLFCDTQKCPISLPCNNHSTPPLGYMEHLKKWILAVLLDIKDTCVVIPCDSLEAWIVAAYENRQDAESIRDPWNNVIARGKTYQEIPICGKQKRKILFQQFSEQVCSNWQQVTTLCQSAKDFEQIICTLTA